MTEKNVFFINDSLALIYFYKNDYSLAIRYVEDARDFSEQNFYFHLHLGLYHEAILQKKLEGNKKDDDEKRVEIEELSKKTKEHYNAALKINPDSYNALLNLGSINAAEGYFALAENFYKKALDLNAQNIIMIHNHPGSDNTFSQDDIKTTLELEDALSKLGVKLYDHLLVSDGVFYSARNMHLLNNISNH
jgi:DNA repair protein RadC